jgi:hypothetical protein
MTEMELDIVFVIAACPQSLSLFCHSDLFGIFLWDSRLNKKDSRQAGMTGDVEGFPTDPLQCGDKSGNDKNKKVYEPHQTSPY